MYFQILLNEPHLGFYYLSNYIKIVIFSSKLVKFINHLCNIELTKNQSNLAWGGDASLKLKFSGTCTQFYYQTGFWRS